MKRSFYSLSAIAAILLSACSANQGVAVDGQQVTVQVGQGDAKLVRLEVVGEKIIRVSATAESRFADPQSLIIVPQTEKTATLPKTATP